MRRVYPVLTALMLVVTFAVAGCESSEERAQRHYESALALLEEGDAKRAFVEFRNVFKLNPRHKEARMAYARARMERGETSEAYGQFLRVVEQYPDTTEARILLTEMAILNRNWKEARRHGEMAIELAPEDPRTGILETALAYSEASQDENAEDRAKFGEQASTQLDEMPESLIARRIVIDHLMNTGKLQAALPVIDAGLEQQPESYELHRIKLSAEARAGDSDAVGATLRAMVEAFPDDEEASRLLISWYLQQGDIDGAEAFLRELAQRPDAEDGAQLAVVQFLLRTKGDDAARAELQRLIENNDDKTRYIAVLASLDFGAGEQEQAITTLEQLVDAAETPTDDINNAKYLLARFLATTGNNVGARARIEEILADDTSHVGALKARAGWLIEDDNPNAAIIDLRTALSQAPRDAEIMTLMAGAHERAGDRALAGERYALAVEFSDKAPAESLRYARYLIAEQRPDAALAVVNEALNEAPQTIELLQLVGSLHIGNKDWDNAQRTIWKLRAIESPEATLAANSIEAEMLLQQDRLEDTIQFLEGLAETTGDDRALTALIRTQIQAGEIEEAVRIVDERLQENSKDSAMRFLRAGLYIIEGQRDRAKAVYRGLLEEFPGSDTVIKPLFGLLIAEGRPEDARALIDEQIALNPQAVNVRMLKAELLERDRDFEGAIAIYEELYEENSNNIIVANNLASLITTHRDDQASLDRAFAVARRLRGVEQPALQDTYGWIEYRRGNYEEALLHLEPAARGLSTDPLVQYHLGRTYLKLERFEDARETLQKAVDLSSEPYLPQIETALELLGTIPEGTTEQKSE